MTHQKDYIDQRKFKSDIERIHYADVQAMLEAERTHRELYTQQSLQELSDKLVMCASRVKELLEKNDYQITNYATNDFAHAVVDNAAYIRQLCIILEMQVNK